MASSDSSELAPPMLLRILLSSDRGVVGVVGVRGVVGSFTGEDLDAKRRVGAASTLSLPSSSGFVAVIAEVDGDDDEFHLDAFATSTRGRVLALPRAVTIRGDDGDVGRDDGDDLFNTDCVAPVENGRAIPVSTLSKDGRRLSIPLVLLLSALGPHSSGLIIGAAVSLFVACLLIAGSVLALASLALPAIFFTPFTR